MKNFTLTAIIASVLLLLLQPETSAQKTRPQLPKKNPLILTPIRPPVVKKQINSGGGGGGGEEDPGPIECVEADPGPNKTISCGNSTTIGGTYNSNYSYSWSPSTNLSSAFAVNPTANPKKTTTYTLTMTPIPNLITNGSFESGNSGFSSDYSNGISTGNYTSYAISSAPTAIYNWWCMTPPTDGNNMLVADGATSANQRVWYQTISITPNTYYAFSGQFLNIFNNNGINDPNIVVKVNGTTVVNSSLPFDGCNWSVLSGGWLSGASDYSATIAIYSNPSGSDGYGNDFAIDNLMFSVAYCPITSEQVTVTVTDVPTISPAGPVNVCYYWEPGFTQTLTASISSNLRWNINGNEIPNQAGSVQSGSTIDITTNTFALDHSQSPKLFPVKQFSVTDLTTGCTSDPVTINAIMMPEFDWWDNPPRASASLYGTGFSFTNYSITDSWVGNPLGYGSGSSLSWAIVSPSSVTALSSTSQSPLSVYFPNIASYPDAGAAGYFTYSLTMSGSDYGCVNTTDVEGFYIEDLATIKHLFQKLPVTPITTTTLLADPISIPLDLLVFPNPTRRQFTISSIDDFEKVQVIAPSGQLLKTINAKGRTSQLNAENWPPGTYLLKIFYPKSVKIRKLVVVK
ncbi:MAG: T9SS type A sorting domain-containing protein [Chitinophagaceae bacterium]|nr:T9SS type A sorting domain-containing protein [Chitinophagaceae bacterium]